MPNITAGQPTGINIPAGQVLTLVGSSNVTGMLRIFTPDRAGYSQTNVMPGASSYGPYLADVNCGLQCWTGDVDYSVAASTVPSAKAGLPQGVDADYAAAVVGAAGVISTVPADLLVSPSTTTTGDGISALTPYQIAAPGTYRKARLYWRNISNTGPAVDRLLYVAANAPNATRGLKQSQDSKRRDASMVFGDHIMLVSAAPITSLVFSSDGSISENTHNLMISWGN